MSQWTHAICDDCWDDKNPDRPVSRLVDEYRQIEHCCFCGTHTQSGIYLREDPADVPHPASHP